MTASSGSAARRRPSGRPRRIRKPVALATLALLIAALTGFLIWCSILYPAVPTTFDEVMDDAALVVSEAPEALVLRPSGDSTDTGLLFVPGAKVPAEAYAYKLGALAASGTTVVISKPILNLALFDYRSMDTFTALAPEIDSWDVGGHSLGGVKACAWASDSAVHGLILFGSYCANDLSESDLAVLSIGGSEDGLSTPADIARRSESLPIDAELVEIAGSNHAQFGNYGKQPGDGVAEISDAEVKERIDELLADFTGG